MSFLRNVRNAYRKGQEFAEVQENMAWIGKDKIGNQNRLYDLRDAWYKRSQQLDRERKDMPFLERLAFSVGDDITTLETPYPLQHPYPLRIKFN